MTPSIEAVIISGPKKGEIIFLEDDTFVAGSDAEIEALNNALDSLTSSIERVSLEIRTTIEALRTPVKASQCPGPVSGRPYRKLRLWSIG